MKCYLSLSFLKTRIFTFFGRNPKRLFDLIFWKCLSNKKKERKEGKTSRLVWFKLTRQINVNQLWNNFSHNISKTGLTDHQLYDALVDQLNILAPNTAIADNLQAILTTDHIHKWLYKGVLPQSKYIRQAFSMVATNSPNKYGNLVIGSRREARNILKTSIINGKKKITANDTAFNLFKTRCLKHNFKSILNAPYASTNLELIEAISYLMINTAFIYQRLNDTKLPERPGLLTVGVFEAIVDSKKLLNVVDSNFLLSSLGEEVNKRKKISVKYLERTALQVLLESLLPPTDLFR